jgi:lipopolysaccharide assembly outer membrane protein LptD (OstA)
MALACCRIAHAQYQPPSDYLNLTAESASTWSSGNSNVVQLQGPVTIQTDRATMTADRAVVWLTPLPGTVFDQQRAEIALIGNASLTQGPIARSGGTLFVETEVRGAVRLTAGQRSAENLSDSDLYRDATAMRPIANLALDGTAGSGQWIIQRPWLSLPPAGNATTQPATLPSPPKQEFSIRFGNLETVTTPEMKVAAILSNGVTLIETKGNEVTELRAERVVLFTPLSSLEDLSLAEKRAKIEQSVTSAYLEGDVRITQTPADRRAAEQRLTAERVFYDFATDRAVLTDAVIHTVEPTRQIPLILRAQTVRQLSKGEYRANGVELSTSSFAVPSYSIRADRAYVRQYDTGDERLGQRMVFSSTNNTVDVHHVPLFYWPWAAGSMTEHGFPLRSLLIGSSRGFGFGLRSEWGLFESIGRPPPEDLDISYNLDWFADRGPAGGVSASYKGGFITETSKQPWNFEGDFSSYIVNDHGIDRLSRRRRVEPDDNIRYQVQWEHQHFFPEDWQLQLRAGTASDPTFLEEWYERDFNEGLPHDLSAYLKRQRDTEALTLAANIQPRDFVTTADQLQEQFEVERIPELGYYRVGDSFGNDQFTFFSANTVSGLHFKTSDADLVDDLAFRGGLSPGLPAEGTTGVTDDTIYRGDFRQEIAYPISAGQFRVLPYFVGRLTGYSDSPDESNQGRVYVGTGIRFNTSFWKVDDSAESRLLDIHRLRHVIEPELHLYTSAETVDRTDVFVYDEQVDAINDITAAQIALRQRWQTKRGGPGRWRSVDFFTLNVEGNFFLNQPADDVLDPTGFRGLFFPSLPEASIPRNGINADALWRISDSTALLSDVQYNLDDLTLATTSIGLAVQRDTRLSYFLGARYIGEINSMIASAAANYQLSSKYSLRGTQSFNLGERRNQNSAITLVRLFDRFFMSFTFYYDAIDDESGFRFGIAPQGLGYGLSSDQLNQALGNQ